MISLKEKIVKKLDFSPKNGFKSINKKMIHRSTIMPFHDMLRSDFVAKKITDECNQLL